MIFALLFILAFLIGLVTFLLTDKWIVAVLLSMFLFLLTTISDTAAQDNWLFTLIFGLPIVFVASLLGAYVVAIRRGEDLELSDEHDDNGGHEHNAKANQSSQSEPSDSNESG